MIKLSILIPTIKDRNEQFHQLFSYLQNLLDLHDLNDTVELCFLADNREMTIGKKRQELLEMADGLYSWQIDDDDSIHQDSILYILDAMKDNPDCITFEEACNINGVEKRSNFSLKYDDWGNDIDGFDFVRTPFFKTPIKTSICLQVPVPNERFGEDHLWAKAIKPLLKSEVHIPKQLYFYQHISSPHNERYGIK